ncbi:MAG: type II CRISPR-associated endonuclease Cas1 [Desulfitobacteriaceae bacterium]
MSFRTIVIANKCKLSYKNDYLVVRGEDVKMIHLSEIKMVMVDSTLVSVTTYLLCEMVKRKIKVVFCDENRNPISEIIPYYGSHNTSKRIRTQIQWEMETEKLVWTCIVREKIANQAKLLDKLERPEAKKLEGYVEQLEFDDITNREGHAAKVYFGSMFGIGFKRDEGNDINAALNYGYTILLSAFNKEVVAKGYLTQLGLNHRNEFNYFNLSCDLMEPFRPIVDRIVYQYRNEMFDADYKMRLINVLNTVVQIDGSDNFLNNAIQIYINTIFAAIEQQNTSIIQFCNFI